MKKNTTNVTANTPKAPLFTASNGIEIKTYNEGDKYDTMYIAIPIANVEDAKIFVNCKVFSSDKTNTGYYTAPFSSKGKNVYYDWFTIGTRLQEALQNAVYEYLNR